MIYFAAARALGDELQKQAVGSDYSRHAEASVFAARLAEEEGRTEDARAIATAFRLGARVWPYPTVFTPYTWTSTPSAAPVLLQLEARPLDEWQKEGALRISPLQAFAFAAPSVTDPKAALASGPPLIPLRLDADGALLRGNLGRLLERAGRPEDALVYLRAAASDCGPLDDAFSAVRAHAWLAQFHETRGDRAVACTQYAKVLEHWGGAKKSVTADQARARRKTLGC